MPDTNQTTTREKVIARAYRRIGIDNPSTTKMAQAAELLNDVLREIAFEGRWLWLIDNTESVLTTVAGQKEYTVGDGASEIASNILQLDSAVYLNGTTRVPLDIYNKSESLTTVLLDSSSTGDPQGIHLERGLTTTTNKLHVFPTPTMVYTIRYNFMRGIYDLDNSTDVPDLPQEWNIKLSKILARELAPENGVTINEIIQYHEPKADQAIAKGRESNSLSDGEPPSPVIVEYF